MAHARLGPHDHGCLQCVELATSRDDLLATLERILEEARDPNVERLALAAIEKAKS